MKNVGFFLLEYFEQYELALAHRLHLFEVYFRYEENKGTAAVFDDQFDMFSGLLGHSFDSSTHNNCFFVFNRK